MNNRVDPQLKAIVLLLGTLLVCPPAWLSARNEPSRVVAVGDVHGDLDSFVTILQKAKIIDATHNWVGGNATLVQTGDFLDRGARDREVMDFLIALEKDARNKRGQVVVLLGNHEVMNMMGDLRYVSAPAYASFADSKSEKVRRDAYRAHMKLAERRAKLSQKPKPKWTPEAEKSWMEKHPPGFVEHRKAFGPRGKYGRWLRKHDAVVQIGDVLFVHGGLHPALATSVRQINNRIKDELQAFDEHRRYMIANQLILPFFTFPEMVNAARAEIEMQGQVPLTSRLTEENSGRKTELLNQFLNIVNFYIMHPNGPLWFRGFAMWSQEEGAKSLPGLLRAYKANHFVVGHTRQVNGMRMRFDGKVFLIDTGMLEQVYEEGKASALEIQDGRFTAIYLDKQEVLLDPGAPDRSELNQESPHGYELSQLLGLNNIPPTVDRNINGKRGTLQAWIEGALDRAEILYQVM